MGRNDDYTYRLGYRTQMAINFIAKYLEQIGRLDETELLFTDWGSHEPLCRSLVLSPQAVQLTSFIYVSPQTLLEQFNTEEFNATCAVNVTLRRAQGEFVLLTLSDTFFSAQALSALFDLILNKGTLPFHLQKTFFFIPRRHLPWQLVARGASAEELEQFLLFFQAKYDHISMGGHSGGFLACAKVWHELEGCDEHLEIPIIADVELLTRLSFKYACADPAILGITAIDFEHSPFDYKRAAVRAACAGKMYIHKVMNINGKNWGLADKDFPIQKSHSVKQPIFSKNLELEYPSDYIEEFYKHFQKINDPLINKHLSRTARIFCEKYPISSINKADLTAAIILIWYCNHFYPIRYLEFGMQNCFTAGVVASICNYIEIYGILSGKG